MLAGILMMTAAQASQPSQTELTVYNQGFALVKEQRSINLQRGMQEVRVEDVAQMIESDSVAIRSLTEEGSFTVLEQNYQYDLISPIAILNKAVGKHITFHRVLPNGEKESIRGILLSAPTAVVSQGGGSSQMTWNGLVIQADDGRILLNPTGEIAVESIPEGLISKPTLVWLLESRLAGRNNIELSYLTQGMSWTATYVLALDAAGTLGNLKGWVTLNNQSGATYENASLKLLAGDVQRVRDNMRMEMARGGGGAAPAAKSFEEEQFGDYHLYTLQRPTTVANKEQKQVSLLEGNDVPVKRKLVLDAMRGYQGWRPQPENVVGSGVIKPSILIEFTNDEASNLGMPLPMGRIKVYQRDSSGSLQMLGEDQIQHTPRNEKLSLAVGQAFDVVAERKRMSFEWLDGRRGARETFEIEVRNRKETAETVHLWERHWGDWRITQHNMDFTKLDANTAEFVVSLAPNEVKKVTYTVETYWPN